MCLLRPPTVQKLSQNTSDTGTAIFHRGKHQESVASVGIADGAEEDPSPAEELMRTV